MLQPAIITVAITGAIPRKADTPAVPVTPSEQIESTHEIEVFDVAMLYNAKALADRGLLKRPCHVQFVMGIPNALPVRRKLLEFLIGELKDLLPDATWAAAGIGRQQLEVNEWCLELGGHVRTGLEDNIKFDKTRLARSNAELVARVADMCAAKGRLAAGSAEARQILQLPLV
jgi:3-oxoadipate:acetyl-CoA acetyltransferase